MKHEFAIDYCIKYPELKNNDIRLVSRDTTDKHSCSNFILDTPFNEKRMVELYIPNAQKHSGCVLFLHWYEPGEPDTSNRFQFREEAIKLAEQGIVCLCVETLWSDLDFFYKRTQLDDWKNSIKEIIHIRRYIDFLLKNYNGSLDKTILVGHDFGGMYGLAASSLDTRIKHQVIMAATAYFSDWYFYYPDYPEEKRATYCTKMSVIDPLSAIRKIKPLSLLLQFGNNDPHVPAVKRSKLEEAAPRGSCVKQYSCGHGLNQQAGIDRVQWIQDIIATNS